MSADNFAGINLETVSDEAEDSEFFAETVSATIFADANASEDYEENITKDVKDTVTEQKAEAVTITNHPAEKDEKIATQPSVENAAGIIAKPDSSLPDDSGPLHGDRLRKYQLRYRLTNRETEVLWEILLKHKTAEIAANLVITIPTAKYHISNILQKTGMRNQRELRYLISKEEN
jgi:DNA-binding CsgD family transcriptional regulator